MKQLLILTSLFITCSAFSQSQLKAEINAKGMASIAFTASQAIHEVLLIVSDSTGTTVYFEQITEHQGLFSRTINLKEYGSGTYHVKLKRDDEDYIKTLFVR